MIHKNFERADNILRQHKFSKKQNTKNIKNNSLSVFSALCSSSFFFGTFANFPSWRVQYKHMHTHSPPNVFQLFAKPKHLTVFLSHFLFPKMIYVLKRKLFSRILFATRYRNVHKRKTGQFEKRESKRNWMNIRIEYLSDEYARSIEKHTAGAASLCCFSKLIRQFL